MLAHYARRRRGTTQSHRSRKGFDLAKRVYHDFVSFYLCLFPSVSLPVCLSSIIDHFTFDSVLCLWRFTRFQANYPPKVHFTAVLKHAIDIFERKFHYFVQTIEGMDQLFEVTFSPLASSGKPLSRCGKCKRFMKYVDAKPHRLHCPTCNDTYSLPPVSFLSTVFIKIVSIHIRSVAVDKQITDD